MKRIYENLVYKQNIEIKILISHLIGSLSQSTRIERDIVILPLTVLLFLINEY